jgi:hypothetical protein
MYKDYAEINNQISCGVGVLNVDYWEETGQWTPGKPHPKPPNPGDDDDNDDHGHHGKHGDRDDDSDDFSVVISLQAFLLALVLAQ